MAEANESVEQLLRELPDPRAARLLFERLTKQKSIETLFQRNPALLSDVLTLSAWSPLLATTLENDPDYITWLQRERKDTRVRTREELGESLGRFALTNSQLDPHVMLSRFRRRELLRTYLHDIRRARTVVETTEELSNLADAILEYALKLSRQELDNRYGAPQVVDSQQRISIAEFCVVALGKLGSSELNYASDIDLIFLFSDDGQTALGGSRGQITNREYFVKLSERLLRLVSEPIGEGASYRIDVRLRPYGREGALACSLAEAVAYYERSAQDWELQALIRSRAAAGSHAVYAEFANRVSQRIFRSGISVSNALQNVRLAKQKIDVQRERKQRGFNVKLGRGGIREIEFIAQALQIAFGGSDPWLRARHTLVSLGRLADRELITEREHWQLSDAYHFLRGLEHRLQMEHGLQTHSVPPDAARRELVARRMNFSGESASADFETALNTHTANVHAAFERVFGAEASSIAFEVPAPRSATIDDAQAQMPLEFAANILAKHSAHSDDAKRIELITRLLNDEAAASLNPPRAISFLMRFAASLDKESEPLLFSDCEVRRLVQLCGVSEFFGEMIASRPSLAHVLSGDEQNGLSELTTDLDHQETFADQLDALRRAWSRAFVRIGAQDCRGILTIAQANSLLSGLAVASIEASLLIAQRQLERRYQKLSAPPRIAVLGLGRLGSGGMDYGSDLDVIIVYDSSAPAPIASLTNEESYARLTEFFITALSSITGKGYLYRVDLRLRPDGQKGALAAASQSFLNYLQERAGIWEWLAYVKLRAVAGDFEFARSIEFAARRSVHDLAQQSDASALREEACRVRDRLEKERGYVRGAGFNIKHGAGGMLDVYFATRYLQLRDNVPDDDEDRTTLRMLARLNEAGSLADTDFAAMSEGYQLLRAVDHQLRLIVGRAAPLPGPAQPAFKDIARRLNFGTAEELSTQIRARMQAIRGAYDRVMES